MKNQESGEPQIRVPHASRVLVSASRRNELPEARKCGSASRRDAATNTRDAWGTRTPRTRRWWLGVLGFLLLAADAAIAASPIALPSAEWIGSTDADLGRAVFRRSFAVKPGLQSAVVLGATGGEAVVYLNGTRAGRFTMRERAESFEVSRHLRSGENTLAIEAARGASEDVACILQLVFDTGRHEWIVTDGSWLTATRRDAPDSEWKPVARLGRVDAKADENPFDPTRATDAYNSWMLARGTSEATDPATIRVPPGFAVELLRSAQPGEDSWIAMAFDPQGRITVAREKTPGLLRLTLGAATVEKVEVIEETLRECRGLLYAHGALYAHANSSKVLVRLRDTDGDDRFDEMKELLRTEGGTGHGRNHLRLGPDGMIYLITGDDVALPPVRWERSPFQRFASPPWIPGGRDAQMFGPEGRLLTGWLARTDRDGTRFEIVAGGLRNPLDVAFSEDGEMFTYEADNERDIGNPWYKPSRVHHLVSGSDYAWRRGTGVLPSDAPDVLPTMHDVGLGSPTGVEFGTGAKFPEKYRRALFIADWAYGRILALHLAPRGASYSATREEFATGRPLNVTDMAVGPDGALYFTTGGRGTQSGLYRIRYLGHPDALAVKPESKTTMELRALRRSLEAFHSRDRSGDGVSVLATAWPQLGHADRWIRNAARIALETVEVREWRGRALGARKPGSALTALLALARVGGDTDRREIVARLNEMELAEFSEEQQLAALRIYEIALPGIATPEIAQAAAAKLDALYPAGSAELNRELCKLLVNLGAANVVAKATPLLAAASTQEDRMHFLFFLRHAPGPWTIEQRRVFFDAIRQAERGQGAQNYVGTVRAIKSAAAASLSDEERIALAPWLEDKSIVATNAGQTTRAVRFVREWTLEELAASLDRVGAKRSFARGKQAFESAQCRACHRMGAGPDAGGVFGPDLTAVASRFGRRDLLVAVMDPSRAMDEKYRNTILRLRDGSQVVGVVEAESPEGISLRPNPLSEETMMVPVAKIAEVTPSGISPMPAGLLNMLERDVILDLLAYLEAGGNAEHPAFR